jgi:hypothetical protein
MLPQVLEANDDGTVSVDPTFVRELAALVTISRDLSKMVDDELLDQYWARKLAVTGSGALISAFAAPVLERAPGLPR